jgi:hypothetical protein
VTTSKECISHGSGWDQIFRTPSKIQDGKDDFEDGIYELVLGAQIFAVTKSGESTRKSEHPFGRLRIPQFNEGVGLAN